MFIALILIYACMLTAGATLHAITVRFTTKFPVPTSPTPQMQVAKTTTGIVLLATASHNDVRVWEAIPSDECAECISAFG